MEFLKPPMYEWFYNEDYDAVVALTTITTHIYVYLGRFSGANASGALTIPSTFIAPSASPMLP